MLVQEVNEADALAGAFAALMRARVQALIVQHTTFADSHRKSIVDLVAQHHLPAIYGTRGVVDAGGLMSY